MTPELIRAALLAALAGERPVVTIADYVASVDWSTVDGAVSADVAALLGRLHELTTAVDEGDIEKAEFLAAARDLARSPVRAPRGR